jgi:hypothetical protein
MPATPVAQLRKIQAFSVFGVGRRPSQTHGEQPRLKPVMEVFFRPVQPLIKTQDYSAELQGISSFGTP